MSSTPACGRPSATILRAASIIATTADLLSAPRIVPAAFRRRRPRRPGSIGPCGGTVSRSAQKKIGVPLSTGRAGGRAGCPLGVDLRPRVVLVEVEADCPGSAAHAVGDRALVARRAGDRGELEEEPQSTVNKALCETTRTSYNRSTVRVSSTVAHDLVQKSLVGEALEQRSRRRSSWPTTTKLSRCQRVRVRAARLRPRRAARAPRHRRGRQRRAPRPITTGAAAVDGRAHRPDSPSLQATAPSCR